MNWLPPAGQIARLGELRSLVISFGGRCALWRGGRLYPLPSEVDTSKTFAEYEGRHRLPPPSPRFYLGAHPNGKQLYIIPASTSRALGPGHGTGPAAHLLREFLGTPLGSRSRVAVSSPENSIPIGAIRVVVYHARKPHLEQYGEFTHDHAAPYPELRMNRGGWYYVGGRYRCNWRGIVN